VFVLGPAVMALGVFFLVLDIDLHPAGIRIVASLIVIGFGGFLVSRLLSGTIDSTQVAEGAGQGCFVRGARQ
jgi:hypothetical protein